MTDSFTALSSETMPQYSYDGLGLFTSVFRCSRRCRSLENDLTAVNAALAAHIAALAEARKSQAAAERRCGQLDAQQTQLTAALRDSRDEIEVLHEEAAALEAEHAETTARAVRLEGSCQEAAAKVWRLEAAARAGDAERRCLAAGGEALEAELDAMRAKLADRESELEQVSDQLTLTIKEVWGRHTSRRDNSTFLSVPHIYCFEHVIHGILMLWCRHKCKLPSFLSLSSTGKSSKQIWGPVAMSYTSLAQHLLSRSSSSQQQCRKSQLSKQ